MTKSDRKKLRKAKLRLMFEEKLAQKEWWKMARKSAELYRGGNENNHSR